MMLSDESKERCKTIVKKMKDEIREAQSNTTVLPSDNEILITAVLTMDFFLTEVPFDSQAAERLNQEIDIVNRITSKYRL